MDIVMDILHSIEVMSELVAITCAVYIWFRHQEHVYIWIRHQEHFYIWNIFIRIRHQEHFGDDVIRI